MASGYDGEIDWETEIIASDLAALQKAEYAKANGDGKESISLTRENLWSEGKMHFTFLERLTGMVMWPRNQDPRIKGPQPRIITIEQTHALERMAEEQTDTVKAED